MKNKKTLLKSGIALLLCVSMLIGSTYAWFTDNVTTAGNIIKSGKLELEMYWTDDPDSGVWHDVEDPAYNTIFSYEKWEPGYTDVKYVKLVNKGNLALNYSLTLAPQNEVGKLAEVINVYFAESEVALQQRSDLSNLRAIGLLSNVLNGGATAEGTLLAPGQQSPLHPNGSEVIMTLAMSMITTAGNDYQQESSGDFTIAALATQASFEEDSFGSSYDSTAEYPPLLIANSVSAAVTPVNGKVPAGGVTMSKNGIAAYVPAGVSLEDGTDKLTLSITPLADSGSGITTLNNEILIPVDVHIDGVAEDNTVPIIIDLGKVLPKYLNMGNYHLVHVEDGTNAVMTLVDSKNDLVAHNQFTYDPLTGAVSIAMASFSEVALLADTTAAWQGEIAEAFSGGDGSEGNPYLIANADQLAYFNECISNDNETYGEKNYKLLSNVNLGGNDQIFYPIGYHKVGGEISLLGADDAPETFYIEGERAPAMSTATGEGSDVWYTYGGSFRGVFDGNGHTVSNFYQNTWSMKGNYSGNYWNAAMGLFGYVNGGTVKNLTVDNFNSDGEFTPTGVITAYAANSTFENIAITNCNPRVYNTGNGGIVGIGGNSSDPDSYKLTFTNITIDNTNKISALWGSWDVACGGLVGMFRGDGHVYMTNCHVAAQIDVFNDVCGNYQYYWYRYSGMMVGTNKNMTTDANGYTVPETDKFHAENCTVHFGEWNDYYYCELVANSLASYTHDHQFSRLDQIQNVSEIQDENGNWSKTGNFIVMNGKTPTETCYHIMKDADGNLYEHKHDVADATNPQVNETVGGGTVLKENNQRIYLPFNQLFTGYGWGVKHIPVYNGENYAFDGITILDREKADSVEKFTYIGGDSLNNNKEYTVGELFGAIDAEVDVKNENVQVTVSPVEGSNVSGVYTANTTDWTKGTLVISGSGAAVITITDYYFCKPTTAVVSITDRANETKFETKFTGDFLYRVGNKNNVALGSLFAQVAGTSAIVSETVNVTVETLQGNATGTYTANADWTKGTIKFAGTGAVAVTITDENYCNATVLHLEVVDATNITSATGTTSGGSFVLLSDVTTSDYVYYWNSTVYGNGFTYSLAGAPTNYSSSHGHGVLITKNATLDNLVIVGDVYDEYGAYTTNNDYNAAIDVLGETVIQNCYISGCAAPVSTRANATILNSTLYGGTVANLIIKSGTVTLEDVTTANYDDGRALVGMGIVAHSDATESAKLVLNGTLTQYNFISEEKVPSNTYAKNLHTAMFGDSCSNYHFGTSPSRYVNTGIISLTALFNGEDITDNANTGYAGIAMTLSGVNGYVYTQLNTDGSVNNNYNKETDLHVGHTQGAIAPTYSFDFTEKNYLAKQDGSNDYCYEENGQVNISMDEGETFSWDTSILTATKFGETLGYTVSMNGTDYTGKSIAFDTTGDYTVTYTYTDGDNLKLDAEGNITTYSKSYTKTVKISVAVIKAATKHAEFTFGSGNTASTTVTDGNNTYVMPNVNATSSTIGSTTVSGKTIYYPIVEIVMSDNKTSHNSAWYAYFPVFSGAVTITDYKDNGTGEAETFGSSTQSMPSGLSIVGDPAQLFKYQSSSSAGTSPVVKNNILVYSSPSISAKRSEYNTVIQYSYQDHAGATYYYYIGYHAPAQSYSSVCVTPDTLVTLADGSKKQIQNVRVGDSVKAWNFYTGAYENVPVSLLQTHGTGVQDVLRLKFEDGTELKILGEHGVYDADLDTFVFIDKDDVTDYVGHRFVKQDGDSFTTVELVDYEVFTEDTTAYTILSLDHYNVMLEDLFTVTPAHVGDNFFNPFDVGADMKYDEAEVQADIEKYGLYTYEDFDYVLTQEQFVALNLGHFKVSVGKGYITYDGIIYLIETFINNEDFNV